LRGLIAPADAVPVPAATNQSHRPGNPLAASEPLAQASACTSGPIRATMLARSGDLTGIAILDEKQRIRVHVGVDGNGEPFLSLLDADGNQIWSAH
jgi:hypothetical protein